MFCGSYYCLKVSHLPGWCYLAVSVLLLPRQIVKVQLGLGKICSQQDDMKEDRTMVLYSQLACLFSDLEQKKPCSLFISSKTTSRGAVPLSVSLWRPGLICDTFVPVLPIFYFSSSWHYKKQLIVLSRSNSTCEYLFSHTCLLFSICFYWHSEAESFIVMWHWLWCAQWNRNLWIVLPCNFLSDIYDNWDPLKKKWLNNILTAIFIHLCVTITNVDW